jgi:hypothetical protein
MPCAKKGMRDVWDEGRSIKENPATIQQTRGHGEMGTRRKKD